MPSCQKGISSDTKGIGQCTVHENLTARLTKMEAFVAEAVNETVGAFQELSAPIRPHRSQVDEQYQFVCAAHEARSGKAKKDWPEGTGAYNNSNDVRGRAQAGPIKAVTSLKQKKQTYSASLGCGKGLQIRPSLLLLVLHHQSLTLKWHVLWS